MGVASVITQREIFNSFRWKSFFEHGLGINEIVFIDDQSPVFCCQKVYVFVSGNTIRFGRTHASFVMLLLLEKYNSCKYVEESALPLLAKKGNFLQ